MTHEDSMGNKTVIQAGDVQRMSAGTGLTHSEFNLADTPVHFYQIWLFPDESNLKPSYDQRRFDEEAWKNKLLPVASGQGIGGTVTFHTAATLYRCMLGAGKTVTHDVSPGRRIFIYLTEGSIDVNNVTLGAKDQARIDVEEPLVLKAKQPSELILINVPSCKGWGYSDQTLKGKKSL